MRVLTPLLLLAVMVAPATSAQVASGNPSASAERARMDNMNERLRGTTVAYSDETNGGGRQKSYNMVEVKKKMIEMNQLIQSVNADVINANKGVLSADMAKKLKRIEKLSKEVRQQFE